MHYSRELLYSYPFTNKDIATTYTYIICPTVHKCVWQYQKVNTPLHDLCMAVHKEQLLLHRKQRIVL